jgi:hypothetical protein
MSDASLPSQTIFDSAAPSFQQRVNRGGFFTALAEALRHSRQLEAQRVIRRYRHLIDAKSRDRILKGIADVPQ